MIKEIYGEKLVKTVIEEQRFCDVCKKEIPHKNIFYHCWSSHRDYPDDIFEYDICSDECLKVIFNEYVDGPNTSYGKRIIYNDSPTTGCFEIERRYLK